MPAASASPDALAQTLTRHDLRPTPTRRAVLQAFSGKPYALTGAEIEQELGSGTDRITLYRTLKAFEQQGLLHRVADETDVVRYAACSIECSPGAHFDNHVHFKCEVCHRTYCLSQIAIPGVTLPGRFTAQRRDYLLWGTCGQCQST
jgi:Fur family ferric uptake transcriptional regulator